MNRQREIIVTVTYNELGIILDTKAEPRKTGRWISMTSNSNNYRCSVCGRMLVGITDGKNMVTKNYPYCHCGAKMLKEGENIDS
jgi:DNA-directed RNA polymerase subunit RPC12/RpoP